MLELFSSRAIEQVKILSTKTHHTGLKAQQVKCPLGVRIHIIRVAFPTAKMGQQDSFIRLEENGRAFEMIAEYEFLLHW
jgi:hypothetical protein